RRSDFWLLVFRRGTRRFRRSCALRGRAARRFGRPGPNSAERFAGSLRIADCAGIVEVRLARVAGGLRRELALADAAFGARRRARRKRTLAALAVVRGQRGYQAIVLGALGEPAGAELDSAGRQDGKGA